MRKYAGMRSIACLAICGVLMTSVVSPEAATLKVQKTNQKHNIATAKDYLNIIFLFLFFMPLNSKLYIFKVFIKKLKLSNNK